jgi:TonB family protein
MNSPDDDATPPQGVPIPVVPAQSLQGAGGRRVQPAEDGRGVAMGLALTVAVHFAVGVTSLRLGRAEGNVSVRTAAAPQQVIETQLLQRGGGDFDPRRIVHRQTPTRAEREAPRQVAVSTDPTAVQLRPDAGADEYMNAIITGRRRPARGNQDLAELERIAQMAAAEQAADPTAPPGPGDPTGSDHGTTTDPNAASRGAVAKLQEFFYQNIHLTTTLTGSERTTMSVRVTLDATGQVTSARIGTSSGNDAIDADVLVQVQALVERNARIESLTPEELGVVGGRGIQVALRPSRL